MFERYTEEARRVIFFARYEASRFGNTAIQPEHLLLAIIRLDKVRPQPLLAQPHLQSIQKEIEEHMEQGPSISTSVDMPLDEASKRVLAHAARETSRPEKDEIDLEHLLLALSHEENSFAAAILKDRNFDFAEVRARLQSS